MGNPNPGLEFSTVAGIERAKKNWWELWSEELIEMTHWLSRVFPTLKEGSWLSNITSAFVAKVLMGGYKDASELGERTWERILLLINRGSLQKKFQELGMDPEVAQGIFWLSSAEIVPSLDTMSPAALAWYAQIKLQRDLQSLGVDQEVIDKYTN